MIKGLIKKDLYNLAAYKTQEKKKKSKIKNKLKVNLICIIIN